MDKSPDSIEIDKLKLELSVARNEIQNLRKQITSLGHVNRKSVLHVNATLERLGQSTSDGVDDEQQAGASNSKIKKTCREPINESVLFKPIGIIRTVFPEKRAVPRQPSVGSQLVGSIELDKTIDTNALAGLNKFSHIWIVYHFHRNEPNTKSKVAPPRLNGERVGVFSTRSPHRPCPIGLSLVEVHAIEGNCIYFLGTDMVDRTPVLDIKPYIPRDDNPFGDGVSSIATQMPPGDFSREEPDGEESTEELNANVKSASAYLPVTVKVPSWIAAPATLTVVFNELADDQLTQLGIDKQSIVDVMAHDPRSVYLRTKYASQIFTFQLHEVVVTCKFDDSNATVTIVRVRPVRDYDGQ